jgi:hypothetical protein
MQETYIPTGFLRRSSETKEASILFLQTSQLGKNEWTKDLTLRSYMPLQDDWTLGPPLRLFPSC